MYTSDECYKMALTDAISVACRALGVGADVYWEADRSKYSAPPAAPEKPAEVPLCSDCGGVIKGQRRKDGSIWSAAEIAEYTEEHMDYVTRFRMTPYEGNSNLDKISHAVCSMALDVDAKAIVVCSVSGITARMVSRFRCPVDIVGITTDRKVWRKLALSWGVTPIMAEKFPSMDVMFYYAKKATAEVLNLQPGDNIVLTGGAIGGSSGNTDTIKIETIA